jgi:hypothetical protein
VLYTTVLYLHLGSVFAFLLAHGASAGASFQLKKERSPQGAHALVEMSTSSLYIAHASVLAIIITGVTLGFIGHAWSHWWIWGAIVILLGLYGVMGFSGYHDARRILGIPYFHSRESISPAVGDPTERATALEASLSRARPERLLVIGSAGLLAILALMVYKPF